MSAGITSPTLDYYIDLDAQVDAAENDGILARWQFGRALLSERPGKKLRNGRIDEICEATGKQKSEINARVAFADRYKSEKEFSDAVGEFQSWRRIVHEALGPKRPPPNGTDPRAIVDTDADDVVTDRWTLLAGRLSKRGTAIEAGSVDLIVTDPPYAKESLPLWSELAELGAKLLKPQGVLVALSGKIHLLDVLERLSAQLDYGWVYCQPLPGPATRILKRHAIQQWKPWLAFSNGPWPAGRIDWHRDSLDAVGMSKTRHRWEQSVRPAVQLIETLSPANGLVLDPFTGTGTYGEAALQAGRRFIGIEPDANRFEHARRRLEAL